MKKLLLAGVAALSLLNAAGAQTPATKAKLPGAMLGAWCGQWGWQFPDDEAEHWWRTDGDPGGCGNLAACASAKTATITSGLDHRAPVNSQLSNLDAMVNLRTI
jgi:hypothetical protein